MSNLIRCPQCEMPYLPGEAAFCGNCGTKLPSSTKENRQLSRIENAPQPYIVLRSISALINIAGWMLIIGGWVIALLWLFAFNSTIQEMPGVEGTVLVQKVSPIFVLIAGFLNTLVGLMIIGMGQVFFVILDIRDDMNSTMQYVRYGLKRSEK
jgi:hypothetical protein